MALSNRFITLLSVTVIVTCGIPALANSPNPNNPQGIRVEADIVSGEPAIAQGAEEWHVVLPRSLSQSLSKANPRFRLLAPSLFAKRGNGGDTAGTRAASNALTADFNGDGKSDLILIGTAGNTLTAMAALSDRGQWIVQAINLLVVDVNTVRGGIERYVKYFPKGTMLPDRTGRKSSGPGFSFWDDDRGGDLFFFAHGKWVRAIVVGD